MSAIQRIWKFIVFSILCILLMDLSPKYFSELAIQSDRYLLSNLSGMQPQGWNQQQQWQQPQGWNQQQQWQQPQGLFDENVDYVFTSALDENMSLDVSGNEKDNKKLLIWKRHGKFNQLFRIRHVNGRYLILSKAGNAVEVANSSPENETRVHAISMNNSPGMLWEFVPVQGQENSFYLRTFCGKCLDVKGNKAKEGTEVIQWDYNGGKNQIWIVEPSNLLFKSNKEFVITTALDDDMSLDVSGNPEDNKKLIIWKKHGKDNQRFRMKYVGGRYQIISKAGSLVEVANSSPEKGNRVHATSMNNSAGSFWEFIPIQGKQDAYNIRTFCGQCLDVKGNKAKKGTEVIQWDYNGGKNQIWIVTPA